MKSNSLKKNIGVNQAGAISHHQSNPVRSTFSLHYGEHPLAITGCSAQTPSTWPSENLYNQIAPLFGKILLILQLAIGSYQYSLGFTLPYSLASLCRIGILNSRIGKPYFRAGLVASFLKTQNPTRG